MNIEEFISQTMTQIVQGVYKANGELSILGAYIPSKDIYGKTSRLEGNTRKNIIDVNFDVAITVVETDEKSKGAGLAIASILNLGANKDSKIENQIVNRIQFDLPLVLPDDKKPKAKQKTVYYEN